MSNEATSDGGAPMTPPTSKRRALWVATGVAGLTGVVGLAALGGLAARDSKSDKTDRVADTQAATAQQKVSDDGKADAKSDVNAQNGRDQQGDGKEMAGAVRDVPCDEDALIEAIDLANRDQGGTLKLARDCTFKLHEGIDKTGTGLPTIKQDITIQGEGSTIQRRSEEGFRIFRVADGGHLTLKDLTVTGGNVAERKKPVKYVPAPASRTMPKPPHKDDDEDGGGLLVERGGSATLVKTAFTLNSADDNGGAIANFGEVEVQNSTIDNNHAGDNGGGIFNAGALEVEGSTDGKGGESLITNNTAGKNGGGIANGTGKQKHKHDGKKPGKGDLVGSRDGDHDDLKAGTVKVERTLIEGNKADKNGGGISSNGGFVDVSWTFIKNNTACENGGGIYATDTVLTVNKTTVAKNHASKDGGGIYNVSSEEHHGKDKGGSATITDSEILANSAGRFGGGIFNGEPVEEKEKKANSTLMPNHEDLEATLTLRNTKIKENFAGKNGGGIFNNEGKVTLTNTHVTNNKAQVKDQKDNEDIAGGIFNNDGEVTLDEKSTVTKNDPTNCAGTVDDCVD